MKSILRLALLVPVLALSGCGWFSIDDQYGNSYGNFFDYGNRYTWQLSTCEADPGLAQAAVDQRGRWMQCCMWRHGTPIDDATGCDKPPYYNG